MKYSFTKLIVVIISTILIIISCKKETSCEGCATKNNKPPIAVAGPDQLITLPTDSVVLDGRISSDPDGMISSYLWTKISGPVSFTILKSTDSITIIKFLVVGTYQLELKVTDNDGLSAKDTMKIIVDPVVTTNHPPIANAGADQTITLPTNKIDLDGSNSSDPENNITGYIWTKISGPLSSTIANANTAQTQVTNLLQGTYQFELKVTDAGGLFSKDTMQVIVQPITPPPAIACNIANRPQSNTDLTVYTQLPEPRYRITVATVGNKILVAGGFKSYTGLVPADFSSRVDIYDITTGQWTTTHLSQPRIVGAVAVLGNKIFFAGGHDNNSLKTTVDIYDISANTWSITQLSVARQDFASGVIDNKAFFAGGLDVPNLFNIVDIYDATTNSWSVASLSEARYTNHVDGINVTTVGHKIFFAGGQNCWIMDCPSNKIDTYDAVTNTWSNENYVPQNGVLFAGIASGNKNYWVTGDYWQGGNLVEIRDEVTHTTSYECLSGTLYGNPVKNGNKLIFPISANPMWIPGYIVTHFDVYDVPTNTWSISKLPPPGINIWGFFSINNTVYGMGGTSTINDVLYEKIYTLSF